MWITTKHPLYFETLDFKIVYGAGIFMQAGLNKTVNTLNNFELERLLKKGFVLSNKEVASVISLAKDGETVIDKITALLKKDIEKYLFIMDMASVSMRSAGLSEQEKQSIDIFAELLRIEPEQKKILLEFVTHAFSLDEKICVALFEKMKEAKMNLTMLELKYYMPELDYVTILDDITIAEGESINLVDRCEIRGVVTIPKSTTLHITNANLKLYGKIVVDGGTLLISESQIVNHLFDAEEMIYVKSYSKVVILDSKINCKSRGGFLNQQNGTLEICQCKIRHTTKNSAVKFWGNEITVTNTIFHHCFVAGNGAALLINNGVGEINGCTFDDCEAKNGGAIYTSDRMQINGCQFKGCKVVGYGSAVYFQGEIKSSVMDCECNQCYPEHEEIMQYLGGNKDFNITGDYQIRFSTILDRSLVVSQTGSLTFNKVTVYINKNIVCNGKLHMKQSKLIAGPEMLNRDLIVIKHARECMVNNCEFDGRLSAGIFHATGTRLNISNSLFINIAKGRAIFDALEPTITNCIFSYCLGGALYTCAGKISGCSFINCRAKSGAGILMYGSRGEIKTSNFVRCVSDYSGGAIDISGGHQILSCEYSECKPTNISQ